MAEDSGDKTHDPTAHRRQQAREEGQVARSQDLGSAALLVVGVAGMLYLGASLSDYLAAYFREHLGGQPWMRADVSFAVNRFGGTMWGLAIYLLPLLGVILVAGIAVNVFQVGLLWLPGQLAPKLDRLDPLKGFQRIFSMAGLVRLVMGLFKMTVIASVAFYALYAERDTILAMVGLSVPQVALYTAEICLWTSLKIGAALLILALLDYFYQWWKQEQDLKMTTQEMREEMKNLMGDPQVIARRRAVQRQMVLNRLSKAVPKADVVITNPTELAIAIQYEPETMAAPVVVAKGAGHVAARIRKLALENGIPIVEKKPLAQALYKEVDINRPIPQQLYAAVAEVLAYVYQLKNKKLPGGGQLPGQAA
ncbi:MAG: flagellar biosynthesis protein FlhB [Pirellulales bacterium]|nr:flagellar biosynthesis protein FlhB [Pirellulales bacterium]